MVEPKICRNCIHKNVCEICNTLDLKDAIMIFDFKCEDFLTADVEEVVRCKDCKHWGGITYGQICRKYSGAETKVCTEKDHYCSYGERKPQQEETVKCIDCEYLMFSDCYCECSKAYKGIVSPDDSCGKGKRKQQKEV